MAGDLVVVDVESLRTLAGKLQNSAGAIGGEVGRVKGREYRPEQAGRAYASEGRRIADGVGRLAVWLRNWQDATDKSARAMTANSDGYARADAANVRKIHAAADL